MFNNRNTLLVKFLNGSFEYFNLRFYFINYKSKILYFFIYLASANKKDHKINGNSFLFFMLINNRFQTNQNFKYNSIIFFPKLVFFLLLCRILNFSSYFLVPAVNFEEIVKNKNSNRFSN